MFFLFFFAYIFQLCQNIGGNKFSASGVSPKWVKSKGRRRKKEERGYAKIWEETNFQLREFPRSGSKAKDRGEKKKKERLKVGNNNGQLRIANADFHTKYPKHLIIPTNQQIITNTQVGKILAGGSNYLVIQKQVNWG